MVEKIFQNENVNTLIIDKENNFASTKIVDAELDLINCSFLGEGCVSIDTKNLEYITLSNENLNTLKRLLNQAEKYYQSVEQTDED